MSTDNVSAADWQLLDQCNSEHFYDELSRAGVILSGHFVLRSGKHANTFVDIKGLYPHPRVTKTFARALALRIQRELGEVLLSIRAVVAPAIGGVILAHDTADWISLISQDFDREVMALFSEKDKNDKFYFGRGYDEFIDGGLFVIVEDVITTGRSVRELVELIESLGGKVLLICSIWNRGSITAEETGGVPVISLINRELQTWDLLDCRADGPCAAGVPVNIKHGRGREYVEQYGPSGLS